MADRLTDWAARFRGTRLGGGRTTASPAPTAGTSGPTGTFKPSAPVPRLPNQTNPEMNVHTMGRTEGQSLPAPAPPAPTPPVTGVPMTDPTTGRNGLPNPYSRQFSGAAGVSASKGYQGVPRGLNASSRTEGPIQSTTQPAPDNYLNPMTQGLPAVQQAFTHVGNMGDTYGSYGRPALTFYSQAQNEARAAHPDWPQHFLDNIVGNRMVELAQQYYSQFIVAATQDQYNRFIQNQQWAGNASPFFGKTIIMAGM